MYFDIAAMCSFNQRMLELVLLDCERCYREYRENFDEFIIEKRNSYFACMQYQSKRRNRIFHRTVPIAIGSWIDYRIRGIEKLRESAQLQGAFIFRGVLKTYSNFNTFHSLSLHVRASRENKTVDWYMYVKDEAAAVARTLGSNNSSSGLAITYRDKCVFWTYKGRTRSSRESDEWVELIARSHDLDCGSGCRVLASQYLEVFNVLLSRPHDMNLLENRLLLNAAAIIDRYIALDLAIRLKRNGTGCNKISDAFERGAIHAALSKKNLSETDNWNKSYSQDYNNTTHEGRSGRIRYSLNEVKRATNDAVRNSDALTFPRDALGYICPLANRDLKSVGEQSALADFTICSEETDQRALHRYLRTVASEHGRHMLVIDGILTNTRADWDFGMLLATKRRFGHVTTKYYADRLVLFITRDSIPIKYSREHDAFFSPAETRHFGLRYPESDLVSSTAKLLGIENIRKTPPAKITVSINNVKGSVANVGSRIHLRLMENSLGTTCYVRRHTALLVDSRGNDASHFERFYRAASERFGLDDEGVPVERTPRGPALAALARLYPPERLLVEPHRANDKSPIAMRYVPENRARLNEYMSYLFGRDNYEPESPYNLRLWAAFGNPHGACIEDGVVLDSTTVDALLPKICYNACITVEFVYTTNKMPRASHFHSVDAEALRLLAAASTGTASGVSFGSCGLGIRDTLIGYMVSPHLAYVKNSKHTVIETSRIGTHYYHLVHFLPRYENLSVRAITAGNSVTVVIKGKTLASIGKGSKLANKYGQKNVCSAVMDLRELCWGVTRDGRRVHAQIVYNDVSLVGRQPAGQVYDMLKSPDLAFGPRGEIIAPVDLVIHTLHPYTNNKVFDIKVDTLTHANGFDSQTLPATSHLLRQSSVRERVVQVLGFLGTHLEFVKEPQKRHNDDDDDRQLAKRARRE